MADTDATDEAGAAGPARTLLLHTGGAKTGTSAVQNLLRAGTERLAAAGVTYAGAAPMRAATEITSGNAPPLTKALQAGDEAEVRRLLDLFLGDRATGLASSETLEALDAAAWRRLLAAAAAAGVALRVVHVVRDPLPLLLSVYDQKVKRSGEARPIDDWAPTHTLRVFGYLRLLDALAREGAIRLAVLRYDDVRADLGGAVLGALGLDPRLLDGVAGEGVQVNRSLDRAERRILRQVNAAFGDRHSRQLSDLLIAADPDRRAEPPRHPALPALLRQRHGADVAWVNRTFFPDGPGLALPEPEAGPAPGPEEDPSPEALALGWAIRLMAEDRPSDAADLARHLQAMRRAPRPADPDLPPDFDPVGYLVLNPRLLERRVNPYVHWLRIGRERGLRWD